MVHKHLRFALQGLFFTARVWLLFFEAIKNRELRESDKGEKGLKNKPFKEELNLFSFKGGEGAQCK